MPTRLRAYVPTCRRADVPTCRRADVPTCRRADVPTYRRADVPTCLRAYVPTCRRTDVPTCRRTDVPTCRRADVPTCRRADVPTCLRADGHSNSHTIKISRMLIIIGHWHNYLTWSTTRGGGGGHDALSPFTFFIQMSPVLIFLKRCFETFTKIYLNFRDSSTPPSPLVTPLFWLDVHVMSYFTSTLLIIDKKNLVILMTSSKHADVSKQMSVSSLVNQKRMIPSLVKD